MRWPHSCGDLAGVASDPRFHATFAPARIGLGPQRYGTSSYTSEKSAA